MENDFNVEAYRNSLSNSIGRIDKTIAKLNVTAMAHYDDEDLRECIFDAIGELQHTRKSLCFKLNKYKGGNENVAEKTPF